MTRDYLAGYIRAVTLVKRAASYGDIVNAGYGAMGMGSPFVPRPYVPGTSTLKPADQVQQEQKNTAVGGLTGLAMAYAPGVWRFIPQAAKTGLGVGGGLDVAGRLYAGVNPEPGSVQDYANRVDDYVVGLKERAQHAGVKPYELLQGDTIDKMLQPSGIGINGTLRGIERKINQPTSWTGRIGNRYFRRLARYAEQVPYVGSGLTFMNDYDTYRNQGLSRTQSVLRGLYKSLPFYRIVTAHP